MIKTLKNGVLSSNQLKIIALIAMTIDHIGLYLLPQIPWLRIVGRLAFPIFAYMIGEGCTYTSNRRKYLTNMLILALVCQVATFVVAKSLYMCILVTFSLSILLIYALDNARKTKDLKSGIYAVVSILAVVFITKGLPRILSGTDFAVDYGFLGVLLPVAVYLPSKKSHKLICALSVMLALALRSSLIQWYSLPAILLLALYSGKRGKWNLKNLFYIYYPAHIVAIYIIGYMIFVM